MSWGMQWASMWWMKNKQGNRFSSATSRRNQSWWHLEMIPVTLSSDIWPPELQQNNLCFKPVHLCQLVLAAIGNQYNKYNFSRMDGKGATWRGWLYVLGCPGQTRLTPTIPAYLLTVSPPLSVLKVPAQIINLYKQSYWIRCWEQQTGPKGVSLGSSLCLLVQDT